MSAYPLLFRNLVVAQVPDDISERITYDPAQWLAAIVEQADAALDAWEDSWPISSLAYCRNARESACKAVEALADEDVPNAMIAAFRAGIFIEKAQRDFPVEDWLKQKKELSQKNSRAARKSKGSVNKAKGNAAAIKYIYKHLSDSERSASLSLSDWCEKFKHNTGKAITSKTMSRHLTKLAIPYKGARK